jgi:predicted metalloprotease
VKAERGAGRLLLLVVVAAVVVAVALTHRRESGTDQGMSLGRSSGPIAEVTSAAEGSIRDYWNAELPKVYHRDFTALAGGFQPKTPASRPFTCGGRPQTYDDLHGNAFYCSGGEDYIAWDAADLFPALMERFGSIAPAIVLAHEMGHAIQARAGVQTSSVVRELQADCFAGSWTRYAETSSADRVTVTEGALDSAVATILTLRDPPGTAASAQQAHGLGFDRVNAYQTGYEQGAARCAEFPTRGVVTTELPFQTVSEAQSGGNLPYPETVELLPDSLDGFWRDVVPQLRHGSTFTAPELNPVEGDKLPACGDSADTGGLSQYCAATTSIDWLDSRVEAVHEQVGDLATGAVLSEAWAEAGQRAAGLPTAGHKPGLQRDCFTGAWLAYLAKGNRSDLQLSPGDFDEVLVEIVVSSFAQDGHRTDRGGAFERTNALRTGVFGGQRTCH